MPLGRFTLLSTVLALSTWATTANAALLTWQNPGVGDWFDGGNWDAAGDTPMAGDVARITDGGTATANASVQVDTLNLGSTANTTPASGNLEVSSGDLTLNGELLVGSTTSVSATGTTAQGSLSVNGAVSGVSGVFMLGSNRGAGSTADATLTADSFAGDIDFFAVGRDDAGGSGTGSMTLTHALTLSQKVTFFEVGFTFFDGTHADGQFSAASGDVQAGHVYVGAHLGSQTVAADVSGIASLGNGSLSSDQDGTFAVGQLQTNGSGDVVGELSLNGVSGYGAHLVGVAGGGTASGASTGTLNVGTGGITGGGMSIGTAGNGEANASGLVEVTGGNVVLSGDLNIGTNSGTSDTLADGTLRISNGGLAVDGLVTVGLISGVVSTKQSVASLQMSNGVLSTGLMRVGNVLGAGSTSASATFDNVSGQVEALQVGESFNPAGSPSGHVALTQSVLNAREFVAIGFSNSSTGNGAMTLTDSRLNVGIGADTGGLFGRVFVGTTPGDIAQLDMERSLIDAAGALTMGDGARLSMSIGGGVRVDEYAAIDAQSAFLGGQLFIDFDFTPMLDSMVFDLIVSDSIDGISDDFDSVSIAGLVAGYSASTGTEIIDVGGSQVEAYRLRITRTVPEPGTLWLMAIALLGYIAYPVSRRGQAAKTWDARGARAHHRSSGQPDRRTAAITDCTKPTGSSGMRRIAGSAARTDPGPGNPDPATDRERRRHPDA